MIGILLGTLGVSLLGSMKVGKVVTKGVEAVLRASEGVMRE